MPNQLLPPAQPAYVLRGHNAQIHAVQFSPGNAYLLTGDADGWVVCWCIVYKRPLAAWRAHDNAVLGLAWWTLDTVISHGRDSKLIAWNLKEVETAGFDKILPVEAKGKESQRPETIHELELNTLNFCAFGYCKDPQPPPAQVQESLHRPPLLLAVPHTLDSEAIDIFQLPSTFRLATVPAPKSPEMGMAMALSVYTTAKELVLVAGYESGHTIVWTHPLLPTGNTADQSRPTPYKETWKRLYQNKSHTQPVLSLMVATDKTYFTTTSADAIIAKHPLAEVLGVDVGTAGNPLKTVQTKHSGQQGLSMRNDGRVFASAGWDARARVYSGKNMREVAVLKWHKDGCYATAFASISLGTELASDTKALDTFRTLDSSSIGNSDEQDGSGREVALTSGLDIVAARRSIKAKETHWLAVGAKDGKISLWDLF